MFNLWYFVLMSLFILVSIVSCMYCHVLPHVLARSRCSWYRFLFCCCFFLYRNFISSLILIILVVLYNNCAPIRDLVEGFFINNVLTDILRCN
jgi:hypothetical protein